MFPSYVSTLSILCYFNKHIHAKVISDLIPIQYLCGSSVLFCEWFIQPLTGGSLWTSEHIRHQTQGPSALIMSDCSVHGHEIHLSPLSGCILHFLPHSLTHKHTHTHFSLCVYITTHTLTCHQHQRWNWHWTLRDYQIWKSIFRRLTMIIIVIIIHFANFHCTCNAKKSICTLDRKQIQWGNINNCFCYLVKISRSNVMVKM